MNGIFIKLFNLSISAGWLILAVIFVRFLLKKAPKWICCLLWALVAIRLICPFAPESVLSLIPSSETVPSDIEVMEHPAINSGIAALNRAVNPVLERDFTPAVQESKNPLQTAVSVLSVVWVAGVGAMLLYALISYIKLNKSVGASIVIRDNILACDEVKSPFILGIISPLIYVPSGMEEKTLEYVITHEKAHIARKDHWWKPLGFVILAVYWFNPLCWVAYILLCRDIEMACDEKVINNFDNSAKAVYSQALLECSFPRRKISACPVAFGEVGVKERVKSVLNYKKPAFWIIIVALVACAILTVCFLTNPKRKQKHATTANYKVYTCEQPGRSGPFNITLMDNNTFTYYECYASSYVGEGSWKRNGKQIVLTETMGEEKYNYYFTVDGNDLVFDRERSDSFSWNNPDDGTKFVLSRVLQNGLCTTWLDFTTENSKIYENTSAETTMEEFPGVTFRWTESEISAVTENGTKVLYTGMPVWNVFFCDLNGDGKRELCSQSSCGSGIVDERVLVYDYANDRHFEIQDRMNYDYRLQNADGKLKIVKTDYVHAQTTEPLYGTMALEKGSNGEEISIVWDTEGLVFIPVE